DLQATYERVAASEDPAAVAKLFEERRYEVIYLVDGYLEAWLKQTELPVAERMERPESLLDAGIAAAAAADAAFGGDAYTRYAKAWQAWTPEDRVRFRDGEKEF